MHGGRASRSAGYLFKKYPDDFRSQREQRANFAARVEGSERLAHLILQFTRDGKIAFVDLENWQRAYRKEVRLSSISTYMSKRGRKLAEQILGELK